MKSVALQSNGGLLGTLCADVIAVKVRGLSTTIRERLERSALVLSRDI